MAHYGRRFGNYYGLDTATAIDVAVDVDNPSRRNLIWTQSVTAAIPVVAIDGKESFTRFTDGTTAIADFPQDAREHIEVWECSAQNIDENLDRFFSAPADTIRLSWSEATGDPDSYQVLRSTTTGVFTDSAIALFFSGPATYQFDDGPLDDDTYFHIIRGFDVAGNATDSNEEENTVDGPPAPPTDLDFTHTDSTKTTKLTWTASATATGYNLYDGVDDADILGTPTALGNVVTTSIDQTGVTGRRTYLVRATDGTGNEDGNLSQMVYLDLSAGVQVSRPNAPQTQTASAIADGEIRIVCWYDTRGQRGVATEVNMYVNDGSGGAVDYGTSVGVATVTYTAGTERIVVDSSGVSGGGSTFIVAVRAKTAGGVESQNTDTSSVVTDDTGPGAITLTTSVV